MWGGWLDKILQKALDTKSLACDVIPGMWGNEMSGWQAVTFDTELVSFSPLYLSRTQEMVFLAVKKFIVTVLRQHLKITQCDY